MVRAATGPMTTLIEIFRFFSFTRGGERASRLYEIGLMPVTTPARKSRQKKLQSLTP